jgi:uncharacterized integral membrane protein
VSYEPGQSDPSTPLAGGEGVDKRQLWRLIVAGVILVLGLVFVIQNNERVETTFLVFSVTARLWVGLLVALVFGAVLGLAVEAVWRRRRRRTADPD